MVLIVFCIDVHKWDELPLNINVFYYYLEKLATLSTCRQSIGKGLAMKTSWFVMSCWWWCLVHGLSESSLPESDAYKSEEDLLNELLKGYNKWVLPTPSTNYTVKVNFGLSFVQLLSINEKRQVMKANVWLTLVWKDHQLQWDPALHNGITVSWRLRCVLKFNTFWKVVRLPADVIWKPDVVLLNNADGILDVVYKPNVVLSYDGHILWVPPSIYESTCTIDVRHFPFDVQTCRMTFASWTFSADKVEFTLAGPGIDLKDFVPSGTWDVESGAGEVNFDPSADPPRTDVTFNIVVRRKVVMVATKQKAKDSFTFVYF